jgi:hypothetical protein
MEGEAADESVPVITSARRPRLAWIFAVGLASGLVLAFLAARRSA